MTVGIKACSIISMATNNVVKVKKPSNKDVMAVVMTMESRLEKLEKLAFNKLATKHFYLENMEFKAY